LKEVIEYILAGLIIASFIPLYITINVNMYNPPPKRMDPNIMVLYSNVIEEVLNELITSNNFTPEIIDIASIVRERVGSDVYKDYGYHVRIVSWGVVNITLYSDHVSVYTRDLGNLTVLIIRNDLSSESYYLETPSKTYYRNALYRYDIYTDTSTIIAVAAVLETGITKYIGYYIADGIHRIYLLNLGNRLYIVNNIGENGNIATRYYANHYIVDTYLYYYTRRNMSVYRHLYYVHSIDTWIYDMCCCSSSNPPNHYLRFLEKEVIPVIYTDIDYYGIYDGTITINGVEYEKFYVAAFGYERNYTEYYERRDLYWGYCSCSEACSDQCPYWVRTDQRFDGDRVFMDELTAPLYNAVLMILRDENGELYAVLFYRHEIEFGDTIPVNWKVETLVYMIRVGMIDYEVTLTIWRRAG